VLPVRRDFIWLLAMDRFGRESVGERLRYNPALIRGLTSQNGYKPFGPTATGTIGRVWVVAH
jgi:hypothetical protein